MEMEIEKVMDRKKIAQTISEVFDAGIKFLHKEKLSADDHAKLKAIRTMGTYVNAAVAMVQQETAQARVAIVAERMKQLGYSLPKQLE